VQPNYSVSTSIVAVLAELGLGENLRGTVEFACPASADNRLIAEADNTVFAAKKAPVELRDYRNAKHDALRARRKATLSGPVYKSRR